MAEFTLIGSAPTEISFNVTGISPWGEPQFAVDPITAQSFASTTAHIPPVRGIYAVLDLWVSSTDVQMEPINMSTILVAQLVVPIRNRAWGYVNHIVLSKYVEFSISSVEHGYLNPPNIDTGPPWPGSVGYVTGSSVDLRVSQPLLNRGTGKLGVGKSVNTQVAINPDGTPVAAQPQQLII